MRKAKSPDLALPRNVPGFQKLLKARKFLSKAELYFCLEESSLDNLPPKPHCWWGPKMQLDKFRIVSWNWEAKCWSGGGFGYVTCGWGIHRCPHLHPPLLFSNSSPRYRHNVTPDRGCDNMQFIPVLRRIGTHRCMLVSSQDCAWSHLGLSAVIFTQ